MLDMNKAIPTIFKGILFSSIIFFYQKKTVLAVALLATGIFGLITYQKMNKK
jgi:FtsH-binding integral membrane protein